MANILLKKFFEEITFLGGLFFYIFLIVLFLILGKEDYALKLFLSLLVIYFLTLVIRIFYFKPRPEKMKYSNFIEKIDASSFPSVHSARTTFLVLFSFFSFFLNSVYLILVLILWFLVLYSRVYLKKHDITDLLGGIILGGLSFAIASFI
jgi:membrane-associated phospholipid phosphatase